MKSQIIRLRQTNKETVMTTRYTFFEKPPEINTLKLSLKLLQFLLQRKKFITYSVTFRENLNNDVFNPVYLYLNTEGF
jgi:hypothetical protein